MLSQIYTIMKAGFLLLAVLFIILAFADKRVGIERYLFVGIGMTFFGMSKVFGPCFKIKN